MAWTLLPRDMDRYQTVLPPLMVRYHGPLRLLMAGHYTSGLQQVVSSFEVMKFGMLEIFHVFVMVNNFGLKKTTYESTSQLFIKSLC